MLHGHAKRLGSFIFYSCYGKSERKNTLLHSSSFFAEESIQSYILSLPLWRRIPSQAMQALQKPFLGFCLKLMLFYCNHKRKFGRIHNTLAVSVKERLMFYLFFGHNRNICYRMQTVKKQHFKELPRYTFFIQPQLMRNKIKMLSSAPAWTVSISPTRESTVKEL